MTPTPEAVTVANIQCLEEMAKVVVGEDPQGCAMAVSLSRQSDNLFGKHVVLEGRVKIPSVKGFEDFTVQTTPRHS